MKFPLTVDEYTKNEQLRLSLKIWDKDIFKANEHLSEGTLDLSTMIFEAIESNTGNKVAPSKSDARNHRKGSRSAQVHSEHDRQRH